MNLPEYVGPTPITEYGCTLCQKWHRKGMDAEYEQHIGFQSKHGYRVRGAVDKGEEFVSYMEKPCNS